MGARRKEKAAGFAGLSEAASERLAALGRLVLEKNRLLNLTAAGTEAEVASRHLADGLAAAAWLRDRFGPAPALADVGSGAGFIGFALKAALPEARVTLVETLAKRARFLDWAAMKTGLDVEVAQGRAEGLPALRGRFDAVLERALAPLPEALAVCAPLARPGGVVIAWQSGPEPAASFPAGLAFETSVAYRLPGEAQERYLQVYRRD